MLYVFDTSALIKRYHLEEGTPVVQRLFEDPANLLLVSIVAVIETLATFHRLHRQRLITTRELDEILSRFYGDFRVQRFAVLDVTAHHVDWCHQLIFRYHVTAADALILAAAITTRTHRPIFVSADTRSGQLRAAAACGLSTLNPLTPSP